MDEREKFVNHLAREGLRTVLDAYPSRIIKTYLRVKDEDESITSAAYELFKDSLEYHKIYSGAKTAGVEIDAEALYLASMRRVTESLCQSLGINALPITEEGREELMKEYVKTRRHAA